MKFGKIIFIALFGVLISTNSFAEEISFKVICDSALDYAESSSNGAGLEIAMRNAINEFKRPYTAKDESYTPVIKNVSAPSFKTVDEVSRYCFTVNYTFEKKK